MAQRLAAIEGGDAFADFSAKPGVVIELRCHHVDNDLICRASGLGCDPLQFGFQLGPKVTTIL